MYLHLKSFKNNSKLDSDSVACGSSFAAYESKKSRTGTLFDVKELTILRYGDSEIILVR